MVAWNAVLWQTSGAGRGTDSDPTAPVQFMDETPFMVPPELLRRVKAGEEEACDRLVELLYPLVGATVRNHVRRVADHEDVIQEVFMKLFLKIEQYRGIQPLEHWVSRLAVTTSYDWLRKRRARPVRSYSELSEDEAEIVQRTLSGNAGRDSAHQRELFDGLLDRLLEQLNPREQIVIRLVDLEERSIREAQEVTGWSASKIKTTAMRARRKLAQHLRRLEGGPFPSQSET